MMNMKLMRVSWSQRKGRGRVSGYNSSPMRDVGSVLALTWELKLHLWLRSEHLHYIVHLSISIHLKLLTIFILFISYHVSYLIYNFSCHLHLYFTCTPHVSISHLHLSPLLLLMFLLFMTLISYITLSIFILPLCTFSALFCFSLLVGC